MKRIAKGFAIAIALVAGLFALAARRDRPAAEVEARHAKPPSQFIDVAGLRIHFRDRGSGPAVVLLHGSNASLFTWEGWTAALEASHRVIALDLPGHGLTGPDARQRYSPGAMAEVVDAFVRARGLEKFTIAGNSMGGSVAWHYALAHPERVERLILVDAAGQPREEPPALPYRLLALPVIGAIASRLSPRFMIARSVREVYGDPSRLPEGRIDQYEDLILREGNRAAARARLQRPIEDGLHARLSEIQAPTLILWGARDRWILPKYGERFHRDIRGSQLVMLDGLGHVPMEEDPAATVSVVQKFLTAAK